MPAALEKDLVVNEVRTQLSSMKFTVQNFDAYGNLTGTTSTSPSGEGIEQLAQAIGTALFNVLKTQVAVTSVVAVVVGGVPGAGTSEGVVE